MEEFDHIVVGAGSAGCALASRLSEHSKVLLVESGPSDRSPFIRMPRGYAKLMADPKHAWHYAVPKSGANAQEVHVRGRTLGGSSAINGMVYMRGLPRDHDSWGIPGWGWSDFLKAYREFESQELGGSETRGGSGPLKISTHGFGLPICNAVIEAGEERGIPSAEDLNSVDGETIGYNPRNIARGRRISAARAFLSDAKSRANLTIYTETQVERIVFDGRRAKGLVLRRSDGQASVNATRDIWLCAGAFQSPKLLLLSGIGPAQNLRENGIEVVADSPGVGGNLSDHRFFQLQFRVSYGSDNKEFSGWRVVRNAMRQALLGTGPLARPAFEVGGFIKTDKSLDQPDFRLLMGNFSRNLDAAGIVIEDQPGICIGGYQMRPESRGHLELGGPIPDTPLRVHTRAFSEAADVGCAVRAVHFIRELAASAPLRPFRPKEMFPGNEVASDADIADFVRRASSSGQHVSGTCRMGTDAASVVDQNLRVRGVDGLRVADLSIIPSLTSGNTNAPAMAIGYLAADHI